MINFDDIEFLGNCQKRRKREEDSDSHKNIRQENPESTFTFARQRDIPDSEVRPASTSSALPQHGAGTSFQEWQDIPTLDEGQDDNEKSGEHQESSKDKCTQTLVTGDFLVNTANLYSGELCE